MVKLSWKYPFILREQARSIIAETGKGLFSREPFSPNKDIKTYYDYYEGDSVVHSAVDSLADGSVGRGFDTEIEKDDEAKELVDEFCEVHNLDMQITNITKNMLIAGFLPVETFITSVPERCILQIIHPKTVKKLEWDETHTKPLRLIQTVGNNTATIDYNKLTWFTYNKLGNDPFGTSLVASVTELLAYKEKAVEQMDAIMQRYASPKGIWKSRGSIKPIMDTVLKNKQGEDLFLGNVPDEEIDKIVEFLDIDPRARFWEYIEYIDRLIYAGLPAPNLFYFKDATEASARVLLEIVDRNIYAVGRILKREIEKKWFKPLVTLALGEGHEVPKIKWRQRPAMKDLSLPELIGKGLDKGYIDFDAYHEIMKLLGVTWEKTIEEMKQEYEQRKAISQQQFQRKQEQTPIPFQHSTGKTFIVTDLSSGKPILDAEKLEAPLKEVYQKIQNIRVWQFREKLGDNLAELELNVKQVADEIRSYEAKSEEEQKSLNGLIKQFYDALNNLSSRFDNMLLRIDNKLTVMSQEDQELVRKEKQMLDHLSKKLNIR